MLLCCLVPLSAIFRWNGATKLFLKRLSFENASREQPQINFQYKKHKYVQKPTSPNLKDNNPECPNLDLFVYYY